MTLICGMWLLILEVLIAILTWAISMRYPETSPTFVDIVFYASIVLIVATISIQAVIWWRARSTPRSEPAMPDKPLFDRSVHLTGSTNNGFINTGDININRRFEFTEASVDRIVQMLGGASKVAVVAAGSAGSKAAAEKIAEGLGGRGLQVSLRTIQMQTAFDPQHPVSILHDGLFGVPEKPVVYVDVSVPAPS